jgi:hypothetical protein
MEAFFKKVKPATTAAAQDVDMEHTTLMEQATSKPKYTPWIEK